MTINALSASTIHLLGSSQVLTTPASLIKELIDNALDAKATCIDILISQNTIDKIEVRDNGDGIQLDDLDALGRRGHTSKLRTFTELRNLGGRSLGFRGEALASACQLGDVSITTKTDGQPVGTRVKLKAMGGIQSQSRTSHPIGTTVCVMNFMSKLPVRKQTALKEAPKTIGKIQELVKRYALARVSIKLTFKIVKGSKGAWSYAPRPHGGIKDSVSLIIGRDAALQCSETSMLFSDLPDHEGLNVLAGVGTANEVAASHFCLKAFLPRNDADLNKLGKGQYLSVDSRPVASERGTMKKIITIFKKYVRSALTAESSSEKIKNPFIRLNIVCPEASYDPNVEPAKDDIIFENEKLVLEAAEKMFKNFYGECDTVISRLAKNSIETDSAGFDILLARSTRQDFPTPSAIVGAPLTLKDTHFVTSSNSNIMSNVGPVITNDASSIAESENSEVSEESSALGMNRKWGCDMSQDYTEYTDGFCHQASVNHMQKQYGLNSNGQPVSTDLNPWVIAKMTAPIQDETATRSSNINTNSSSNILLNSIEDDSLQVMSPQRVTAAAAPSPQIRRIDKPNASLADILQSHSNFRRHVHESRMQSADFTDSMTENDLPVRNHRHSHLNSNGFTTATKFVETSLMSPPNTSPNMQQQKKTRGEGLNKPFISPFRTPNSSGVSVGLVQTQLKLPYQPFIVQGEACDPPTTAAISDPETQQTNPELDWAMDFEHRKEDAIRRRRDELQAMRDTFRQPSAMDQASSRQSPHKNRYNAALASLERPTENLEEFSPETNSSGVKTSLPDSDPRGYFMKRQRSFSVLSSITGGPRKLKRAQILRLPLESIPADLEIHRIVQIVPSGIQSISNLVMETSKQDTYVCQGVQAIGLEMTATDREAVGKQLYQVVEAWMNSGRGEKCDVEFVFGGLDSLHGA
ncbi:hypothetical protein sscle_02g018440 [Sclerotinia sclerotiorum 1980 UF-70]|uniref:DNA mismatch repair protein S5 domain-containing protein n=1 Tax=Sclerotinia sclerotiorum (strain ATCC 18683 / 1980 / Ss-1) TaxID=665079 RepID=A0A1D9PWJ6_SCLS1|nr:hypothetical protein sscle_02g018440 [Sclerotinia sclerotiorum 1980 UF-70]